MLPFCTGSFIVWQLFTDYRKNIKIFEVENQEQISAFLISILYYRFRRYVKQFFISMERSEEFESKVNRVTR